MCHKGFANSEFGFDGLRSSRVAIDGRGEFVAGKIKAAGLKVIAAQQQLHLRLGRRIDLWRLTVFHQPSAENLFDVVVVFVSARGHRAFANEGNQVDRQLIAMLIEQRLVFQIGIVGQVFITQPQVERRLQQWSDGAVFVDGQTDATDARVTLRDDVAGGFPPGFIDARDVVQHAGCQRSGGHEVLAGLRRLQVADQRVPTKVRIAGDSRGPLILEQSRRAEKLVFRRNFQSSQHGRR